MKSKNWIAIIFALVGTGLLVGTIFLVQHTRNFVSTAQHARGIVADLIFSRSSDSSSYRPDVRFVTGNGQTIRFVSSTGSNPPAYDVGEEVEVLYQAEHPQDARIKGFMDLWFGATILGAFAVVFSAIGYGMLLFSRNTAKTRLRLQKEGMPVDSQFKAVEHNTSLKVNGRSPWRIVSQWHDPISNQVHVFRSDNIWFDPSDFITHRNIPVLVDRDNPKTYWVDLSFLPKQA